MGFGLAEVTMAAASELTLSTGTTPTTPAAGQVGFYFDSAAAAPGAKLIDSAGTQYTLAAGTPYGQTNEFRLTGVSATPIMTTDSTSLSTIYLTPYKGQRIALYNGSTWDLISSAEVSLAVTGRTTDLPFDIFAYSNLGTVTLEFLDWSNSTTRATALVRQDGVWCKTGSLTRRYVGTCRARSATTFHWVRAGVDLPCKFDLFNMNNRVSQSYILTATTNTWDYTLATWRQAQGNANYQIEITAGLQEEELSVALIVVSRNSSISIDRYVGIGFDATTAFTGVTGTCTNTGVGQNASQVARLDHQPTVGRHYYAWLEKSVASGTCTWVGDDGGLLLQSGMTGTWTC